MAIDNIAFEAGYITITREGDIKTRYAIADVIRVLDIPTGLSYTQVATITTLANLIVILIRTLMKRGVLDESFIDDKGMNWDLDHLIYAVEQMGGTFHDPDLDDT